MSCEITCCIIYLNQLEHIPFLMCCQPELEVIQRNSCLGFLCVCMHCGVFHGGLCEFEEHKTGQTCSISGNGCSHWVRKVLRGNSCIEEEVMDGAWRVSLGTSFANERLQYQHAAYKK